MTFCFILFYFSSFLWLFNRSPSLQSSGFYLFHLISFPNSNNYSPLFQKMLRFIGLDFYFKTFFVLVILLSKIHIKENVKVFKWKISYVWRARKCHVVIQVWKGAKRKTKFNASNHFPDISFTLLYFLFSKFRLTAVLGSDNLVIISNILYSSQMTVA